MAHLVLGGRDEVRVAIAQVSPAFLDKRTCVERAEQVIAQAAEAGADLVAFPEVWLAGYPYWTEGWDSSLADFVAARVRWFDNAVHVGGEETTRIGEAARRHQILVVMGCNEIDGRASVNTIYNCQLYFDRDGTLLGRHRKLMPTYGERQYWGMGALEDLQVFETDIGRVGGLTCGEHLMPLVRAAMIELGEEIHIAGFPGSFALHTGPRLEELDTRGDFWAVPSTRNHAFEAGAFVLRACGYQDPADVDASFPHSSTMNISYARGGSAVINPLGVQMAESSFDPEIIYADCPAWMIKAAKAIVDTAGHYARPDLIRLAVCGPGGWTIAAPRDEVPAGFGDRLYRVFDPRDAAVAASSSAAARKPAAVGTVPPDALEAP